MWTAPLKGAFRFQFTVIWQYRVQKLCFSLWASRVLPGLCFKTRGGAQPLIWKSFFILKQIKLIFTRKVVPLASFWIESEGFWKSELAYTKWNFLPHLSQKLLKWLHFPGEKLFHMYKCRTCFHCNSVSFLPDCPTCSEFETLWQTVQDLKEQVANNKMQCIIIFRILAKYRNPAGLSRKKRYLTIPPFSRFVDYRNLLSFSYEMFRNI